MRILGSKPKSRWMAEMSALVSLISPGCIGSMFLAAFFPIASSEFFEGHSGNFVADVFLVMTVGCKKGSITGNVDQPGYPA